MTQTRKIAILVGSLREGSLNRKAAKAMARLAPDHLEFDFVPIGDLPLYDADLDGDDPPEPWRAFRERVRAADGVLFVTPEYNRSVPGGLKNAIDVGSRPYGHSAFEKKPAAVVTVSPGAIGGFGANHHLRQMTVFLDMPMMQQPEAYIGGAGDMFGDDGEVKQEKTEKFLRTIVHAYADWVEKIAGGAGELE